MEHAVEVCVKTLKFYSAGWVLVFRFKDGSYISLVCTDWGPEMEKNGYVDNLDVSVLDGGYVEWIINEAY